ncbi:MAG: hypothetical protein U1E39_03120 [Planctomycetota bacterium]
MSRPALTLLLAAAVWAGLGGATAASAKGMGDCERKVPAEADRVFERVASAFRKRQATGVSDAVDPSKGGRVYLSLTGIEAGSYTREQAAELLASTYFADRSVVSLQQAEGCTTGDETRLTRTYRLTTQSGGKTVDGTLTLTLHKKKIDDKTSAWFLGSLKDV